MNNKKILYIIKKIKKFKIKMIKIINNKQIKIIQI